MGRSSWNHELRAALENPIIFELIAGQYDDSVHAISLLEQISLDGVNAIAGHAYGSKKLDIILEQMAVVIRFRLKPILRILEKLTGGSIKNAI